MKYDTCPQICPNCGAHLDAGEVCDCIGKDEGDHEKD